MNGLTIVSGGQSGVDQAALDAARELGMPYGGFVPRGRWTENGPLSADYVGLLETDERHPAVRTRLNVLATDATLIFSRGPCEGGTLLTLVTAEEHGKPHLHIDLVQADPSQAVLEIRDWLTIVAPRTLNVGGPRESKQRGIYEDVKSILVNTLKDRD